MQPWFCVQHFIWGVKSNCYYFLFKSSSKTLLSERAHANLRKWLTCLFASLAKEQFSLQAISPYICVLPKIPSLSDGIYRSAWMKVSLTVRARWSSSSCVSVRKRRDTCRNSRCYGNFQRKRVVEWPLLYILSFILYQHRSMDSLPAVIPCSHYFTGE